jgi:hypothetical protein
MARALTMYDYQSYLSGNRSLLGAQGPGYQYGPGFPSHLREWQQNDYDTSGIDYFSRQNAKPRARRRPGYRGPGIGWNGWGNGGVPQYSYQQPSQRPAAGFFGGGGQSQYYPGSVSVGRGQAPPSYARPFPGMRYGFN